MLEYSKVILEKVSFDSWLLKKEFKKLKRWLLKPERKELIRWFRIKFGTIYPELFSK